MKIDIQGRPPIIASLVYANCLKRMRSLTWVGQNTNAPWLLAGDFNVIATISEKFGGRDVHILNAGFRGSSYTWCNNRRGNDRIGECLDRVLYNLEFQSNFPDCNITHLARICSDHTPLHITLEDMRHLKLRDLFFRECGATIRRSCRLWKQTGVFRF